MKTYTIVRENIHTNERRPVLQGQHWHDVNSAFAAWEQVAFGKTSEPKFVDGWRMLVIDEAGKEVR